MNQPTKQRILERWDALQRENEEACHSSHIDVGSIVIALGTILVAFGIGVLVGAKLY